LKVRARSRKNRISSRIGDLFNDEEEPAEQANIGVLDNKLRRMSKRTSRLRFEHYISNAKDDSHASNVTETKNKLGAV
jgi:hypothetical protein